jgi:serine protease Do
MRAPVLLLALALSLPASADLARRRDAVVEVVQRVSPAVVYIGTQQVVERGLRGRNGTLFDELFGGVERRPETVEGLGSGVIIDPSGVVVTNDHVIRGATAIHVVLADGRQLEAEVVGSDADNDLALLRVQAKGALPTARLAPQGSELLMGETAIAIGSPYGLSKTVTVGVVSATGRSFKSDGRVYNDFVQTDASINPGNSGGPLLNVDGEIIGINTAIFSSAQGIGFAIPADKVRRIVAELTQYGKVRPAWVGVEVQDLPRALALQRGWDRTHGVIVSGVDEGSPAQRAGIRRGDILAEVDGARVTDAQDFRQRMRGYTALSPFLVQLFRDGAPRELQVAPVEFPSQKVDALAWDRLGLKLKELRGGLVVQSLKAGSAADAAGLSPGDVVRKLNGAPVGTLAAFREALLSARGSRSVLLVVQRGRYGYYVTLPF